MIGSDVPFGHHLVHNVTDDHELEAEHTSTREVTFSKGEKYCDPLTIFNLHSLSYKNYKVIVSFASPGKLFDVADVDPDHSMYTEFDMTIVNSHYTTFEIRWKYAFIIITLLVMFFPKLNRGGVCSKSRTYTSIGLVFEGYFTKLLTIPFRSWSYQQKWISVLLVMLLFFNDPLVYFEIYNTRVGGEMLGGIYIGLLATFLTTLMLFWLCALDETRLQAVNGPKRSAFKKHWPKYVFAFVWWLFVVITYSTIRMNQIDDPSYEAAEEGDRYVAATVFTAIFMTVYIVWFLAYTFLAVRQLRSLPPAFLFIFFLTFFTFVATVVGMFIAAMYPVPSAALDFLGMYGLYNLYIWTMAFVYAPLRGGGEEWDLSVDTMDNSGVEGSMMGGDEAIDDMQL